jgi:transcriptional regulator with XRE-family HTH domain
MEGAPSKLRKIFGDNVRRRRREKGMSQERLAEEAGLHRTYIGSIERGERNVSLDNIDRISAALSIPPDQMLHPA